MPHLQDAALPALLPITPTVNTANSAVAMDSDWPPGFAPGDDVPPGYEHLVGTRQPPQKSLGSREATRAKQRPGPRPVDRVLSSGLTVSFPRKRAEESKKSARSVRLSSRQEKPQHFLGPSQQERLLMARRTAPAPQTSPHPQGCSLRTSQASLQPSTAALASPVPVNQKPGIDANAISQRELQLLKVGYELQQCTPAIMHCRYHWSA